MTSGTGCLSTRSQYWLIFLSSTIGVSYARVITAQLLLLTFLPINNTLNFNNVNVLDRKDLKYVSETWLLELLL
jgi:hypothetical protein